MAVRKLDGSNWNIVGTTGFTDDPIEFSFAIAPDNTPYVGYSDFSLSGQPVVKKFNGSSWVTVGTAGFMGEIFRPSLAIAPDGTPYFGCNGGNSSNLKATVKKFNGSNWVTIGPEGFSDEQVGEVKMAVAPNGTPYIAYIETGSANAGITVMKFDGNNWIPVGTPKLSAETVYSYGDVDFFITSGGNKAIVAYTSPVANPPNAFTLAATYLKYFNLNCATPPPTGLTQQNMTVDTGETLNNLVAAGVNIK